MSVVARAPIPPFVAPGQIEHQVADLTMVASADVTLEQLQAKLAENQQWLPMDGDASLSLGQLISFNSTGPMRLGFGGWRDLSLQFQFRTKRGELVTVGAGTMKNVAGYDVTKLLVGQRGLLGELVTVSTRTYRQPVAALIASFTPDPRLIATLLPTHSRPIWTVAKADQIHCGYFGDSAAMTFFENVLAEYSPQLRRCSIAEEVEFRHENWARRSEAYPFRMSVPPAKVLDVLSQVALADSAGDLAFGIVVGSCPAGDRERVRAVGERFGTILFDDESPIARMTVQRQLVDRIITAF